MTSSSNQDHHVMVIVLDVSPVVWNIRAMKRQKNDEVRSKAGKETAGPGTLPEVLKSLQAFCGAFCTIHRHALLAIVAVAGYETAMVFPRKDVLHEYFSSGKQQQQQQQQQRIDVRLLQSQMLEGIQELICRKGAAQDNAAMAAGLSVALCFMNRYFVANGMSRGVSALSHSGASLLSTAPDGIASVVNTDNAPKKPAAYTQSHARILMIQASADRSPDYNAFMNCAFCATKRDITLSGCFIPSGIGREPKNSAFLEQACDRTPGGVYLAPTGLAQVGAALTEILLTIFLPLATASTLHLPTISKVDFRARCFQTGEIVDRAFVCNQCLSIFSKRPHGYCPTCGADIIVPSTASSATNGTK